MTLLFSPRRHRRPPIASAVALGLAVALALAAGPMGARAPAQGPAPAEGSAWRPFPAPNFATTTLTGEPVRLADWRPAPGIVYFWSIDCSVCRVELPDLDALYRRFSPRGLQLLAITAPQDRPDRVVQATRALGLPFPVALDFDGRAGRAFGGVALTPTTFLIDGAGQIRARITGRFAPRDLAAAIEALLAARSAPPAISGANGQRTAQGDRR